MADVALPAAPTASPLAALLACKSSDTAATASPVTAAAPADPFAAMLAAAGTKALPAAAPTTLAALALPMQAKAVTTAATTATSDDSPVDGDTPADTADQVPLTDVLASAIAAGPLAVLALAPVAAPHLTRIEPPAPSSARSPSAAAPAKPNPAAAPPLQAMPEATDAAPFSAPAPLPTAALTSTATVANSAPKQTQPVDTGTTALPADGAIPTQTSAGTKPAMAIVSALPQTASTPVTAAPTIGDAAPRAVATSTTKPAAPAVASPSPQATADTTTRSPAPTAAKQATPSAPASRRADPRRHDSVEGTAGLQPAAATMPHIEPRQAAATPVVAADSVVTQTLSIAQDGAWLDTLARDIAASAGGSSTLQFKLNPEHLGTLAVAIAQGSDGASIRLTADSEATRSILVDAQPRLVAEAQAQGLKVGETHVELGRNGRDGNADTGAQPGGSWQQQGAASQQAGAQGQAHGQRQSSTAHQPFVSTLAAKPDAEAEPDSGHADALYA